MTSSLLSSHDRCARKEFLERSWDKWSIHPTEILYRSIEFGLQSDSDDPGKSASNEHLSICTDRGMDIPQSDLYGAATHGAELAEFIVWMVRGVQGPWERPENIGEWKSSAFLDETGLGRVWLVDRWDDQRIMAAEHSWAVQGECSMYELPMTLIVIVIGQRKDARWHSPFTTGYLHPINNVLRFRKRGGETFGPSWHKVWRENFTGSRDEWMNAMTEDEVLQESVIVHKVDVPRNASSIRDLAERKMGLIRSTHIIPDPQFSMCDDPVHPCQFRTCCPEWRLPCEELGFLPKRT